MIQTLEICSSALKNDETSPLLGMAAKVLAQLQSHSDTVMAEAIDWKDKYDQMGQSYNELVDKTGDLAEESGQRLIRCQQLEVDLADERRLNDMLLEKIDDVADENEKLERKLVSWEAWFESLPSQDTATTVTSGDVFRQVDQFEHSLDMQLEDSQQLRLLENLSVVTMASSGEDGNNNSEDGEINDSESEQETLEIIKDFQQLGSLGSSSVVAMSPSDENEKNITANISEDGGTNDIESEQASSSCREVLEADKSFEIGTVTLQDKTLETTSVFQTQTQHVYDTVPALTTSDILVSLSSDDSISTRSSSDLLSLTPTKKTMKISPPPNVFSLTTLSLMKTMKMSPQPNAEWSIIE